MIPVRKYKALWEFIASEIPAINMVFVVDDEAELASKIKEVDDLATMLVAVVPSSDMNATDEDNYGDVDTCLVYLLMKIDPRDHSDEGIMDERELTQNLMGNVREAMLGLGESCDGSDHAKLMAQAIRGKQHIDRERNYLGCNGYSLSFGVKTNGFNP